MILLASLFHCKHFFGSPVFPRRKFLVAGGRGPDQHMLGAAGGGGGEGGNLTFFPLEG